jgi:sugar phosphate isomerase/epimerase
MKNNIYISTGGFKEPAFRIIKKLYRSGIKNIELSGGAYSNNNFSEILKLQKVINMRLHNYFPPPKIPFVLNAASSNEAILNKSMKHIFNSINLANKIKSKYYSFHAGFLLDPKVDRLGKKFDISKLQNRKNCMENFKNNVLKISEYAKSKNILILIENNVVTKKNFQLFGTNPFLLSNPSEITKFFLKAPKNVKLLMDVGHLKVSSKTENFSKIEAIKKLKQFIGCYHFSENDSLSDSNKPFNKKSWFLNYIKKNLDYYTIEVYSKSHRVLKNQLNIIKQHI